MKDCLERFSAKVGTPSGMLRLAYAHLVVVTVAVAAALTLRAASTVPAEEGIDNCLTVGAFVIIMLAGLTCRPEQRHRVWLTGIVMHALAAAMVAGYVHGGHVTSIAPRAGAFGLLVACGGIAMEVGYERLREIASRGHRAPQQT